MCALAPLLSSALAGGAAALLFVLIRSGDGPIGQLFARYGARWNATARDLRLPPALCRVPVWQAGVLCLLGPAAPALGPLPALAVAAAAALLPRILLDRCRARYEAALAGGLDRFLSSLADALPTQPNLAGALVAVLGHTEKPMRREVEELLREVRLGQSLDDALVRMASRLKTPGLDAAVGAALLGRRTGGDLSAILRQLADTLREIARLEGVMRTRTAEGRAQAWVLGAVPPGLVLILDQIDPAWLAPLWSDPIGWGILGAAALLEALAIALIRKIVMVEI